MCSAPCFLTAVKCPYVLLRSTCSCFWSIKSLIGEELCILASGETWQTQIPVHLFQIKLNMRLAPITGQVDLQNCFNMQETMKYSFADMSPQTPVRVDCILFFNTFFLLLGCINKGVYCTNSACCRHDVPQNILYNIKIHSHLSAENVLHVLN